MRPLGIYRPAREGRAYFVKKWGLAKNASFVDVARKLAEERKPGGTPVRVMHYEEDDRLSAARMVGYVYQCEVGKDVHER